MTKVSVTEIREVESSVAKNIYLNRKYSKETQECLISKIKHYILVRAVRTVYLYIDDNTSANKIYNVSLQTVRRCPRRAK